MRRFHQDFQGFFFNGGVSMGFKQKMAKTPPETESSPLENRPFVPDPEMKCHGFPGANDCWNVSGRGNKTAHVLPLFFRKQKADSSRSQNCWPSHLKWVLSSGILSILLAGMICKRYLTNWHFVLWYYYDCIDPKVTEMSIDYVYIYISLYILYAFA